MRLNYGDQGFTAIWTAIVLLFLVGAAALAVDTSEFYQQARQEQTTADLACLAGVQHAPTNPALAIEKAAGYLRPNHSGLRSIDPTTTDSGTPSAGVNTWTTGDFVVKIVTPVNGDNTKMSVTVAQQRNAQFGRVLGADQIGVIQKATCEVGSALNLGELPLALDSVGATECQSTGQNCTVKFSASACTALNGPGNCGSVQIPRHDDPPGSTGANPREYQYNLALGANWGLDQNSTDLCDGTAEPCGVLQTMTGDKRSLLSQGLIRGTQPPNVFPGRLDKDAPHNGNHSPLPATNGWDNHNLGDVASCDSTGGLGSGCQDGTGSHDTTSPAEVYRVYDCTDPRWTSIPIIDAFPGGSQWVDYEGSFFAWLQEPDDEADDSLANADPVHPGEDEFQNPTGGMLLIVAVRPITFPLAELTPVDNVDECGFYQYVPGVPARTRLIENP